MMATKSKKQSIDNSLYKGFKILFRTQIVEIMLLLVLISSVAVEMFLPTTSTIIYYTIIYYPVASLSVFSITALFFNCIKLIGLNHIKQTDKYFNAAFKIKIISAIFAVIILVMVNVLPIEKTGTNVLLQVLSIVLVLFDLVAVYMIIYGARTNKKHNLLQFSKAMQRMWRILMIVNIIAIFVIFVAFISTSGYAIIGALMISGGIVVGVGIYFIVCYIKYTICLYKTQLALKKKS